MSHSSCTKARKRKPGKTDFTLHKYCTVYCELTGEIMLTQEQISNLSNKTANFCSPESKNCEIPTGFFSS